MSEEQHRLTIVNICQHSRVKLVPVVYNIRVGA